MGLEKDPADPDQASVFREQPVFRWQNQSLMAGIENIFFLIELAYSGGLQR